jgi:hypothetical protein
MEVMARLFRTSLAVLLGVTLSAGAASAATTAEQLVALAQAGLDDDILIALIETDGSVFYLSAQDLLDLRRQGLSNRVIRAMQRTASPPAPVLVAPEPQPARAVPPSPAPGAVTVTQVVNVEPPASYALPVYVPVYVHVPVTRPHPPAKPVFWGWGGQRRPDSWDDGVRERSR